MKKQKIIAVYIIIAALLFTVGMVKFGRKKPKEKSARKPSVIRVIKIAPQTEKAVIQATAIVEANQSLSLAPEIGGRIIWVSPKLKAGGRVKKGDVLIRLDDRDYKLQVKQTQVQVENAQLKIDTEAARADVAKEEWAVLGDSGIASDLVLRVRQGEIARLDLISAESALEKAQLNLSRTKIRAPYDASITSENTSVGQVISTQTILATMVERGDLLAEVSLPMGDLHWVEIPDGNRKGSEVTVSQELGGGETIVREGEVVSLVGAIDQQTRRVRLLIRIPAEQDTKGLPLLPGAFVEVSIRGKEIEGAARIPREAVYKGVEAWQVLADSTLKRITINRLWGTSDDVVVQLTDDDTITIATTLPEAAVNGMKVIPMGAENE